MNARSIQRFTKMLDTMFPVETSGRHGELMDGCLYNAFFNCPGAIDGWRIWAGPRLDQFFAIADFFAAGENQ